ncbi:hypothetical protein J6590_060097 [Homalodisca vitripennis]|nr:hypothetical protein J6590_060097 [Homalodisca vitripennis]
MEIVLVVTSIRTVQQSWWLCRETLTQQGPHRLQREVEQGGFNGKLVVVHSHVTDVPSKIIVSQNLFTYSYNCSINMADSSKFKSEYRSVNCYVKKGVPRRKFKKERRKFTRRGMISKGVLLLHDNAPDHRSRVGLAALQECGQPPTLQSLTSNKNIPYGITPRRPVHTGREREQVYNNRDGVFVNIASTLH